MRPSSFSNVPRGRASGIIALEGGGGEKNRGREFSGGPEAIRTAHRIGIENNR